MPHIPSLKELILGTRPRISQNRLAGVANVDRDVIYRAGAGYNVTEGKCRDIVDALNTLVPYSASDGSSKVAYSVISAGGKPGRKPAAAP